MQKLITLCLVLVASLTAQGMAQFCAAPPLTGQSYAVIQPNILIVMDMSSSMTGHCYDVDGRYGYCNPDFTYIPIYTYDPWKDRNRWYFIRGTGPDEASGDSINREAMRRIDIERLVLAGGTGPNVYSKDILYFRSDLDDWHQDGADIKGVITTDPSERRKGVIREISDTDDDFIWDDNAPRFAVLMFNEEDEPIYHNVVSPFGDSLTRMLRIVEQTDPGSGTNAGDGVFAAIHYLRFCEPHWNVPDSAVDYEWDISWVGTAKDPWYEVVGGDTVSASCRPTFAIFMSDGAADDDGYFSDCPHLPHPASPYGSSYWGFCKYNGPDSQDGADGCADDYAYYSHVVDLRPDDDTLYGITNWVTPQTVTWYSVFLFDDDEDGRELCELVAKYGGFIDQNDNKKPDLQSEWDADGDGEPDNFFYAQDGTILEARLMEMLVEIQGLTARITSASAGAITVPTTKSAGVAYSGQFYPRMEPEEGVSRNWLGRISALWLDPFGSLREETEGNRILHLKQDNVVTTFYSSQENMTVAARFADTSGLGIESLFVPLDTVPIESLNFLWDGAEQLLSRDPANRKIFYNKNGFLSEFTTSEDWLDAHLNFGNWQRCDSLIRYIRGEDFPNYRSRECLSQTWKLGDVIHSSPMPVGEPSEGYHLIYGDDSYGGFFGQYRDRRTVVYIGGNDGMLHAFNAGLYEDLDNPFQISQIDNMGSALGSELWGFIPYNQLPHLKWLSDRDYCHVYYHDLTPYPTDVRIFSDDIFHPNGWGTVLITGMRFGGSEIQVGSNWYRSSYSCLDITNPEAVGYPELLWEYTDDSLGYTICQPSVIKIKDKWFLVFGSGPQSLYGESTQKARVYVIDLATGTLSRKIVIPDNNTSITNIFGADWGLNYSVDLIYFGTYDNSGGGKIYRINTHESDNPADWTLHQVIDLGRPITAEGSVATDDYGNIWVYFGTGKYFANADVNDSSTMVFVGIKDDTTSITPFTFGDLLDVTDVEVYADSVAGMAGVSNYNDLVQTVDGYAGWYRTFESPSGERVITTPLVIGNAVIFTSFIPEGDTTGQSSPISDLCMGTTTGPQLGNLWALYYRTGTAYKTAMLGEAVTGEFKTHVSISGDMPSGPAMHIGLEQEKVFIQSAGGLTGVQTPLPYNPRGGIMLWRGK